MDEHIHGLSGMMKQLDKDWSQSKEGRLEITDFRCENITEKSAWVACEMKPIIKIGTKEVELPEMRSTLVLVEKEGQWKIAHTHASWPYAEQKEGDSFPS